MKKIFVFIFLSILSVIVTNAATNDFQLQKWSLACRTWGLLKYYAPHSEKGSKQLVDWDDVLLQSFNKLDSCQQEKDFID